MAEVKGIKETKEVVTAGVQVLALLYTLAKDGLSLSDAMAIGQAFVIDGPLKTALKAGFDGIDQVPAEIADISLAEGLELGQVLFSDVIPIISGLKA